MKFYQAVLSAVPSCGWIQAILHVLSVMFNVTRYDSDDFVISCKYIQILIPDRKTKSKVSLNRILGRKFGPETDKGKFVMNIFMCNRPSIFMTD